MNFNNLTEGDFDLIQKEYKEKPSKKLAQESLSSHYNVSERTIRGWAKKIGVGVMAKNEMNPSKILVYDIETGRIPAMVWWTGKQYISHHQLLEEPKIITIAYKWLGEDEVHDLTWDKHHSDEKMLEEFLQVYNKANMVIGQNNDRFDNRWVNARAMKYGLEVNTYVKSFDIMKETKRLFRLPSYSMSYITKFLGVETKLEHEGIKMWDKIQFGTPDEQAEYLQKMVDYNRQDIVATEDMYLTLRKYMGHKIHFGVLNGGEKYSCPNCGSLDVKLHDTTVTPAGTVQRIMKCNVDNVTYKVTNKTYMNFLDYQIKNGKEDL